MTQVVREEFYRPREGSGLLSLIISTFDAQTRELVLRSQQRCRVGKVAFRVVAAELTPSKRDLLLFCHIPGIQGDRDSFDTLSIQVRPAPYVFEWHCFVFQARSGPVWRPPPPSFCNSSYIQA